MSINYRKVDPAQVSSDVMKQRAMEAEERAYVTETEVTRLERLIAALKEDIDHPTEERLQAESDLLARKDESRKFRQQAVRASGASPLTEEEQYRVKRDFLNKWLEAVERDHAANSALKAETDRLLGLKGKDSLPEEEKAEAAEAARQFEVVLRRLEVAHELAAELIDALEEPTLQAVPDHDHGHGDDAMAAMS